MLITIYSFSLFLVFQFIVRQKTNVNIRQAIARADYDKSLTYSLPPINELNGFIARIMNNG